MIPFSWPHLFQVKLALVACLVGLSLSDDLLLGRGRRKKVLPRRAEPPASFTRSLFKFVPRLAMVLALAVVFAAVVFGRS